MDENFPKVMCPGCEVQMQFDRLDPVDKKLKEAVYVCPRCKTETARTIIVD